MSPALRNFGIKFLATGAGTGYAPVVPGTFGSLMGVVIFLAMIDYPRWLLLVTILGLTAIGILVSDEAEKLFKKKDPSFIVIDEVTGLLVTMLFLPFQVKYVLMAFVIFRLTDIIKPYPAKQLENLHGGLGIMADDIVAGIYAGVIILLGIYFTKV